MKDYKRGGKITGEIIVDGNLILTDNLTVETYVSVTGYIDCAGYSIEAGSWIGAGSWIRAGGSIEAVLGITAFLEITCKGTLSAGLRIMAGVCNWREITDEDRTVTCGKLESGEVVGILVETGTKEVEELTLAEVCKRLGKKVKIVKE